VSDQLLHELRVHQVELETQNEELRRTHRELEISRARYHSLFELAPVGYLTLNEKGEIMETNNTAAILLGELKEDLIRSPLTRFIFPPDQDIFYHARNLLIKDSSPRAFELRLLRNKTEPIWVHFEATLTQEGEQDRVLRLALSDLTEKRRLELHQLGLEKQLEISQRLQSLGILAGGIAHDFNNLLSGIFGYIELAEMASQDPKVIGYLKTAAQATMRTKGLTQQLLTFSMGGAPIKVKGSVAPCVVEAAQFSLSGSAVDCQYDIPEGLWACDFDKTQIAQVIQNLVINARQAMPDGGSIDVTMRNIPLPHPQVEITVKDHGPGIPREVLAHIFDPFFTTKSTGVGLGLSVCFSIVRRHGGTIEAASTPGDGALFTIRLPAFQESVPELAPAQPPLDAPPSAGGRLLVMDDDASVRDVLEALLSSLGYTVVATKNGQEALSQFHAALKANQGFFAVFLDLTVPGGMGGAETAKEIRKVTSTLPVFCISGYSDSPILADPKAYGFTAALRKPFKRAELAGLLWSTGLSSASHL